MQIIFLRKDAYEDDRSRYQYLLDILEEFHNQK